MRNCFFCALLILLVNSLLAQIPIGSFRAHLPFHGFNSIAVAPDAVYAANSSGILYYDKSDKSTGTWSKVDGLSDTRVSCVFYDLASRTLVVGYQNGNLDFISDDGKIRNLPDIKDKAMTGSKNINKILSFNNLAYISCPFGIVVIDPVTLLVKDTWYTRKNNTQYDVNELQVFQNQFFITTPSGIFCTPTDNRAIADFSTWQPIDTLRSMNMTHLCPFGEKLYACQHIEDEIDTLWVCENGEWMHSSIPIFRIRDVIADENEMFVLGWNMLYSFDYAENQNFTHETGWYVLWQDIREAAFDANNIYIADANNGVNIVSRSTLQEEQLAQRGPYSLSTYRLDCVDDVVAYVPGGVSGPWWHLYTNPDFSYMKNNEWHNILRNCSPVLANAYDLTAVAINPLNTNEFYVGSFERGVLKYNENTIVEAYLRDNSPLRSRDSLEACIGGLAFDNANNLWISNCYSDRPLVVLKNDGTWQVFPLSSCVSGNSTAMGDILIDSRGYKWIIEPRDNTIVVLDDKGTISTPSDDRVMKVNMNAAANIETSVVNCIAEDKNGQIWIGCNQGVKVIFNPGNIFDGGVYPQNILIEQINYVQNLFEFEEVLSIAVDDGNRKWVGTASSGVYLISENGEQQLLHFTEEDSPLLGNRILDIKINRRTGEVFFATSNGLVSYMGTATKGSEDFSEVKVFPNPVRPEYRGVVAVSGLMDNAFCKIADAAGNLVWQGYANGGEFTWDGSDFYGKRPATGVYFVFASDKTGKQKKVAKFLFIH